MSDIIELPSSVVTFVDFVAPEQRLPRFLSASDDNFIAIMYPNTLLIGAIGCDTYNKDENYVFNPKKIIVDFSYETVFKVADFDFKQSIKDKLIDDNIIYDMLLDPYFTVASSSGKLPENSNIEWSPLDVYTNKTLLAMSRYDGRIIIITFNNFNSCWEKEFDITDLYFKHYKDNILKKKVEGNLVHCTKVDEYIELKNDLKLIDFSWSGLVRQYDSQQYFLLSTLSSSGIITVWRVSVSYNKCHCELFYCERLKEGGIKPMNIKFCDISENSFLIIIIDSEDLVKSFPFTIVESDVLQMQPLAPPFIINQQKRYCQMSKIYWSMELSLLIIGFGWKLLISKVIISKENNFSTESVNLYLTTNCDISGLYIKDNTAYVTSIDGFLFGLKLCQNINNLELSQIIFQDPSLKDGDNEFLDVFVSPNSAYFAFLKISADLTTLSRKIKSNLVVVCLMAEDQALNILINDNIPFCRKQDVVEEIRRLHVNNKDYLPLSLEKISTAEVQWDNCDLHRLQLTRYLYIFFGYKLNVEHEFVRQSVNKYKSEEISKIKQLESMIILKNIAYWLEGFCEMESKEIQKSDCLFVLRVIRKLELLPNNHISEIVEAAKSVCVKMLQKKKSRGEGGACELQQLLNEASEDVTCIFCGEVCTFNMLDQKCSQGHVFARCCKSLEVCCDKYKVCKMCGAQEKVDDRKDLSNWRLEIVNSNCPLCDGKLLSPNFKFK